MTRATLHAAVARLAAAGVPSPEADARLLLAHVLDASPAAVAVLEEPDECQRAAYESLLRRRCTREPLQHLTGEAPFRRVGVRVGPGVFVPRPETELLAGWAIERAEELAVHATPVVADLGTGSGVIALSVADEVPGARVVAVERDPGALLWTRQNLAGSRVELHEGDLVDALEEWAGAVDLVVCNPPYVPLSAWESVAPEARDHDPATALVAGEDGLDVIRVLESRAARLLRTEGLLGVEHADEQGEAVPALLAATGRWTEIRDHADLAGRARFTTARLAP